MRRDIKAEILAQMGNIPGIAAVYTGWVSPAGIPDAMCPAVSIGGFVVEHRPNTIYRKGLIGRVVVTVTSKSQDANDDIMDWQVEIENCVIQNRNWGQGSVVNSELTRTTTHPFGDVAWANVEFEIFWTEVNP